MKKYEIKYNSVKLDKELYTTVTAPDLESAIEEAKTCIEYADEIMTVAELQAHY